MIVVKFSGGLGNQMYQYVVYGMLKEIYPDTSVRAKILSYK